MTFGSVLKEIRRNHKMSLRRFADVIDVSPAYLSHIENDRVNSVSELFMEKMKLVNHGGKYDDLMKCVQVRKIYHVNDNK